MTNQRDGWPPASGGFGSKEYREAQDHLNRMYGKIVRSIIPPQRENEEMSTGNIMQFFVYDHLPPALQEISKPFAELAAQIVVKQPSNPERSVALRKLLEAKDAAVRASIYKE